tara:strand:- start:6270 stop:7253 length:984 start_codon:yes stop_codon:yes gene_type:complete
MKVLITICFFLFFPTAVMADSLYEARIKITDKSTESWKIAIRKAACMTFIKVSGNKNACGVIDLENELTEIEDQILQFQYHQNNDLYLSVKFDPGFVDRILLKYEQPVWTNNRPKTLVWMQLQKQDSVKRYDKLISESAESRGLHYITPIYDLRDTQNISSSNPISSIKERAKRYSPDSLLIGIEEEQHIKWILIIDGNSVKWQTSSASKEIAIESMISHTADYYASQYAFYAQDLSHDSFFIEFSNIYNYNEYQHLLRKIRQVNDVENIDISEFSDHYLLARITVKHGLDAFTENLQKSGQFALNTGTSHFKRTNISYQWITELKS